MGQVHWVPVEAGDAQMRASHSASGHHNPIKSIFTAKLELFEYPEDHN
jgi:hypothetical protein